MDFNQLRRHCGLDFIDIDFENRYTPIYVRNLFKNLCTNIHRPKIYFKQNSRKSNCTNSLHISLYTCILSHFRLHLTWAYHSETCGFAQNHLFWITWRIFILVLFWTLTLVSFWCFSCIGVFWKKKFRKYWKQITSIINYGGMIILFIYFRD